MSKFVRYETNIESLELVVNEETGDIYASQKATSRMCDVESSTITRFVGGVGFELLSAEIQTAGGLQGGARLLNEKQIFQCIAKYNPSLLVQCAEAGLRVYLYGLAGYQVKPEKQFAVPQTLEDALIFAANEIKQRKLLEQQKELLESQVEILEEDNERQAEIIDELFDYSSIIRIAKFNKVSETNFTWSMLKAVSKKLGMEVKTAPCPRYVTKNLYHHDAWRLAYPGLRLPETTTLVIRPTGTP